ncbi:Biopterin-dependent aromatic amino acid hydroxylase-domain-containing protein [Jimgerdemannia flammicorona]|uniref:Biopterin-dependent aromatic amino acid hydroxylase-domain-containing protein n=2 Tax=Jimgerdemannia flammicorona TaxID=994334 RepID=A0A433QFK8_9FUNG|nr:Biopterin-dependent aromatic amino acid hydroxylase-domain-containing protein [Jimgerdemannia flammicorona]RUS28549.1 Biopterin-dependent aromatic amino acid hydroxylase-domain-containing protein [Jimgerdemannia flammicorona]
MSAQVAHPNNETSHLNHHPPLHKDGDPSIGDAESLRTTLHFSITDKIGGLDECLTVLRSCNVSLTRIESRDTELPYHIRRLPVSRPSKTPQFDYDFFVDFYAKDHKQVSIVREALVKVTSHVKVISTGVSDSIEGSVPWFPRKMSDLDSFAEKVLEMGEDLSKHQFFMSRYILHMSHLVLTAHFHSSIPGSDHPGAQDPAYRARRSEITNIAKTYRSGHPIPDIAYTPSEIATWGAVFRRLTLMFPTAACREHHYIFPLLVQNCGYREDNIPQLQQVSNFLKDCTGFTLRPVMGLLTSRDFLNGFAFRVFHSTQYIRHHSKPLYTPEPDVCHELLGHVPLFADPDFADFSQEIGLASLGATDEDLEKLATIYWFTVEFGLCREGDKVKAYGAGLLSSFGELEYALSDAPEKRPFDPSKAALQKYPVTEYQPVSVAGGGIVAVVYFIAESFKDAKDKVRDFAASLKRPFSVRYNAYTQTIEVLDSKDKIVRYAQNIKDDMRNLVSALEKI